MPRNNPFSMTCILAIVVILGCFLSDTASAQMKEEEEISLAAAISKWEAVTDSYGLLEYSYGYSSFEDGMPVLSLIIHANATDVTEVRPIYYGSEPFDPDPAEFDTVEGLFDFIQQSMNNDSVTSIVVEYDETYGYPTAITVKSNETTSTGGEEGEGTVYYIDPMTIYTILQSDLDMYWGMWNGSAIADYESTFQVSCFCVPSSTTPKRLSVRDGEVVNITDVNTGDPSEDFFFVTVAFLFEEVQRGIDEMYFIVDVQFNSTFGFVSYLYTDVDPGMADEEIGYNVSDFEEVGSDSNTTAEEEEEDAAASDAPSDSPSDSQFGSPSNSPSSPRDSLPDPGSDSANATVDDSSSRSPSLAPSPNSATTSTTSPTTVADGDSPSAPPADPPVDGSSATRKSTQSWGTLLILLVAILGSHIVNTWLV